MQPAATRTGRRSPPTGLWVRWSLRDLRARWVQVAAIALVIALGVGTYAGLSSTAAWRTDSYDASYAATSVHDLLVRTAEGTTAELSELTAALQRVEHPEWFDGTTASLAVPVQIDASSRSEEILVPGLLVGKELVGPGATIDRLALRSGEEIGHDAPDEVLLDERFAAARDLPASGQMRVGGLGDGQVDLRWSGTALTPRYFLLDQERGGFLGTSGFAVMFAPLSRVQELAGQPGRVDELGVALAEGVDPEAARAELEAALGAGESGDTTGGGEGDGATDGTAVGAVEVSLLSEEDAHRTLYDDIDNDQTLYTIFAGLILAGAAFAAFNLTGRIVEAQRRELGIGMSLGLPRPLLGLRPLLVAAEVALVGSGLGVLVGIFMSRAVGGLLEAYFPMPVWRTSLQAGVFLRGAAIGVLLVVGASLWPVLRAVRQPPVEAIRTGPRRTDSGGLARWALRLPLPGRSLAQMPLRDVLRAPRRTLLTSLGIAAMVATLIGVIGMVDSFVATIDHGEAAIVGDDPDRISVTLSGFTLAGDPRVEALRGVPGVERVSEGLRIGGTVSNPTGHGDERSEPVEVLLDVIDFSGDAVYTPEVVEGSLRSDEPSIVLSRKAAEDLGVGVGDTVLLRHPRRDGLGYRWVDSEVPVAALHSNPYRFISFVDAAHASLFDLEDVVNRAEVSLEEGTGVPDVRRDLFEIPGVSAVQPVAETVALIRDAIGQFLDVLALVQVAVLLLAVLIAFNSSSIGADERAREHATMFAFGIPTRSVLAIAVAESAIVGVLATTIGVVAGLGLLVWIVRRLIAETLPEIAFTILVAPSTFVTAGLLGVVAVSLAPLMTLRKLRRMDIPSTLRVVE